jgi:transposase-like protein
LSKLKQLLPRHQDKLDITCPVCDDEILDRHLHYPLLDPMKFSKRYHSHLYEPVSFSWNGQEYGIQYNHCANPFCESFGLTQERFDKVKHKPYRYKLQGAKNRRTKFIVCNDLPIVTKLPKATLNCTTNIFSNWAIAEEIKRLVELQTVIEMEPEYVFHHDGCKYDGTTPFIEKSYFHKRGKSTGNSQKYQCKECKKYTNVLPKKEESTTYHQKRNDVLPLFSKLLLNKTSVRRTCDMLEIGMKTYYTKLEWLYRCCLEFLGKYETRGFQHKSFDKIWLNTDKMQYNLNNIRRKGKGSMDSSFMDDSALQTHIVITADIHSRYVFRSDVAYDWDFTFEQLEEDTLLYREDHVDSFCRKNDRFRLSYYPQEPTKEDEQTYTEYIAELAKIKDRNKLIKGMHINSTYTGIAHFWLIQQMVQSKEWRFVTDDDSSLATAIYRVFSKDFRLYNAHHFVSKIDKKKSAKQKHEEYLEARRFLTSWGSAHGHSIRSLYTLAELYLQEKLQTHHFCEEVDFPHKKAMVWLNNPLEHPFCPRDKGSYMVDCRTDVSGFDFRELASAIMNVNDHATNSFIQQIRRRISILERPLVTATGQGKSYIYANFNPKYAQYALTILRTYYNFCLPFGKADNKKTPAQRMGLTDKVFEMKDIIYMK